MAQTIDEVVSGFVVMATAIEKADSVGRWRWAKELSELLESETTPKGKSKTSETIGARIGTELGREAYSGSWVRQHAAAFKKFPNEPDTVELQRAFMQAVNGNAGKSKTGAPETDEESSEESTKEPKGPKDPLNALEHALKACVAKGIDTAVITARVQLVLNL